MNIRTFAAILSRNPQYNFPKMRGGGGGGGAKAGWNFSENSSDLVMRGIPNKADNKEN